MIENTTTDTAIPAVMAGILDRDDPQALVDAHAAAVAAGQVALAEQVARFAAHLGQQLRATTARCSFELRRCHESRYDELHAEDDEAKAKLLILEAVPALRAAIDALPEDEIDRIWDDFGWTPSFDEDVE